MNLWIPSCFFIKMFICFTKIISIDVAFLFNWERNYSFQIRYAALVSLICWSESKQAGNHMVFLDQNAQNTIWRYTLKDILMKYSPNSNISTQIFHAFFTASKRRNSITEPLFCENVIYHVLNTPPQHNQMRLQPS